MFPKVNRNLAYKMNNYSLEMDRIFTNLYIAIKQNYAIMISNILRAMYQTCPQKLERIDSNGSCNYYRDV